MPELSGGTKVRFVALEISKPTGKCLCKKTAVDFSDYLQVTFAQTHKLTSPRLSLQFPAYLSEYELEGFKKHNGYRAVA